MNTNQPANDSADIPAFDEEPREEPILEEQPILVATPPVQAEEAQPLLAAPEPEPIVEAEPILDAPAPEPVAEAAPIPAAPETEPAATDTKPVTAVKPDLANALEQLGKFIEGGQLKAAKKRHTAINQQIEADASGVSANDKARFSELTHKLLELRDWQGFATRPKRIELCEQMETLSREAAIEPREKAKAIKELQDAWRVLGPSDSKDSQRLWGRFKKASDVAYAPCATYFTELKAIRAQNEKACTAICVNLEAAFASHDWESPDWKAIEQLLRNARSEWRTHADVAGPKRRKLATRFNKSVAALQEKIAAEQMQNQEKKSALIEQARTAVEDTEAPTGRIIEQVKKLQAEWKTIGITDRRRDQKLWKAFRTQCDRAFERREEDSRAKQQVVQQAKTEHDQLLVAFKQTIASGEVDTRSLKEFMDAADRHEAGTRDSNATREHKRLVREARAVIAERAKASHREMLQEVKRKAALCILFENGQIGTEQMDTAWESEVEMLPSINERLLLRKDAASNEAQCDTANREVADLLCVRLEILAELESPADAQQLRMRYQVERLNRELSQGQKETRTPLAQAEDILMDWYCLGSIGRDAGELTQRFYRAESKLFGEL